MRRIAIALSAIAFAVAASALPAVAAPKPAKKEVASESAAKPKKVVVKKAKADKGPKYVSKCKAGQKWDATASINNGACVKKARVKVKSAPKAATAPASSPSAKKVG
jgi:hypothetical protein